jgi:hypothetical protein
MEDLEVSDLNDENGESAIEGAIDEPKDSDRFISGGERSDETVRRLVGGVLYVRFAIARVSWGVCSVELRAARGLMISRVQFAMLRLSMGTVMEERVQLWATHSGERAEYICLPRSVRVSLGECDMEHGGIVPMAGRSAYTI